MFFSLDTILLLLVTISGMLLYVFFFFKQKTAYEMRISDWSSDVCSSDLQRLEAARLATELGVSMTPVRDSLNRLAGERLVHSSPGEGFQVPLLSETDRKSVG